MKRILDQSLRDFLYWHAVSKMRMADFHDANSIFLMLHEASPEDIKSVIGRIYCLIRLGEFDVAGELVAKMRKLSLVPIEATSPGRLHRRCEFERGKAQQLSAANESRFVRRVKERQRIKMPHTLGDDQMARLAAEQLQQ